MKMTTREVEGVRILSLGGRFDAHEVPQVRKELGAAIVAAGGKVVVNLSDVVFIDSSGLASLVQGMKHSREAGGDLFLCALPQPVRIIFELTRLDKAFEIFSSEEQAVRAIVTG